jgi:hypothetical protein
MSSRALVYVGSDDRPRVRGPRGIARTKRLLEQHGVAVMVFDGLDHHTIGTEPQLTATVLPRVLAWLGGPSMGTNPPWAADPSH